MKTGYHEQYYRLQQSGSESEPFTDAPFVSACQGPTEPWSFVFVMSLMTPYTELAVAWELEWDE